MLTFPRTQSILQDLGRSVGDEKTRRTRMIPLTPTNVWQTSLPWTQIEGPIRAIGFGGQLPPGATLLAMPARTEGQLNGSVGWPGCFVPLETRSQFFDQGGLWVPRGGIIDFGTEIEAARVTVTFPWSYMDDVGMGALSGAVDDADQATYSRLSSMPLARESALAWIFGATPGVSVVPFVGVSTIWQISPRAALGTGVDAYLPPDATTVTIHFTDNANDNAIQGVETGDFEVYWGCADNLVTNTAESWMHNPNDDLDGAGRGSITLAHNAESYTIPKGARSIAIIQPSTAAAFRAFIAVT